MPSCHLTWLMLFLKSVGSILKISLPMQVMSDNISFVSAYRPDSCSNFPQTNQWIWCCWWLCLRGREWCLMTSITSKIFRFSSNVEFGIDFLYEKSWQSIFSVSLPNLTRNFHTHSRSFSGRIQPDTCAKIQTVLQSKKFSNQYVTTFYNLL